MVQALKSYDYLALARKKVLDAVRSLDATAYTRVFSIGPGSIARTLTHVMISEWYYVQRMQGLDTPPYEQWPIKDENPPAFAVLDAHWTDQADHTRAAIRAVSHWDTPLEYLVTDDEGQRKIITASPADQFTQLFQHEVHHRAQVINMLRQLGITIGDVDFNALMFPRRGAT